MSGAIPLLHGDDYANESDIGVGDEPPSATQWVIHYPEAGELAIATHLQLPAGTERREPSRQFRVDGTEWWARSSPGTNQGLGSPVD